jgi:hypothetical protein
VSDRFPRVLRFAAPPCLPRCPGSGTGGRAAPRARRHHRGHGPRPAGHPRKPGVWHGDAGPGGASRHRLRPDRGCPFVGRRLPAVPALRQPLGQSHGAGRHPARAGRQCGKPRAGATRRGADGGPLLRPCPAERARARTASQRARDPGRGIGALRGGGAGWHDPARKRRSRYPGPAARRGGCQRSGGKRTLGNAGAQAGHGLRDTVGPLGSRAGLLDHARDAARPGERTGGL